MGRPSKAAEVLQNEKKSHRTKAEIELRKAAEAAALSGIRMREFQETKSDEIAHREFARVKKILTAIGKFDAVYESTINEYCMLRSDIARYTDLRRQAAENDRLTPDERYQMTLECDRQIDKYKRRRFDIEKENGMTIASSMRAIPKKPEQKENPLLAALQDD